MKSSARFREQVQQQVEKAKSLGRWWLQKVGMSGLRLNEKIMSKDFSPDVSQKAIQELMKEVHP